MDIRGIAVSFLTIATLMAAGCGRSAPEAPEGQLLQRAEAPDGLGEAQLWTPQMSGGLGATVSQPYQVWLSSRIPTQRTAMVMEADKTNALRLAWHGARELHVCYEDARILSFRNFFVAAARESRDLYEVELVLRKVGSLDDC